MRCVIKERFFRLGEDDLLILATVLALDLAEDHEREQASLS